MSVSPIELSLARRTWQDAMVGFVGFFLMYITCEVIRSPRKIAWYIFFVIVGSYGALVKESGVMLLGLCAAPILWELFVRERAFIRGAIFVSLNVLGLGASIAILSNVAGGLSNVTEALSHFREVMGSASYGAKYCSGPWYQIIKGFWILSPATTVLCGFAIINVLITNGRDVTLRKERIGLRGKYRYLE